MLELQRTVSREERGNTVFFLPQYLPVYTPSEEEKENPSLFANNVRKVMAKYVRSCLSFNV